MPSTSSYPSATSVVSTQTFASTVPLRASTSQKDYASAFANLQSTYGTNGLAPSPVPTKKSKSKSSSRALSTATNMTPPSTTSTKDYESAFAALSSSFGFGGGAPSLPQKVTQPKATKSKKTQVSSSSASPSSKDYEATFAKLAVSYGGGWSGVTASLSRKA